MSKLQDELLEIISQPLVTGSVSKVIIRLCSEIDLLKDKLIDTRKELGFKDE